MAFGADRAGRGPAFRPTWREASCHSRFRDHSYGDLPDDLDFAVNARRFDHRASRAAQPRPGSSPPLMPSALGSLDGPLYSNGVSFNTIQKLAGATGTALFITVMTTRTSAGIEAGMDPVASQAQGIHSAFLWGSVLAVTTAILSIFGGGGGGTVRVRQRALRVYGDLVKRHRRSACCHCMWPQADRAGEAEAQANRQRCPQSDDVQYGSFSTDTSPSTPSCTESIPSRHGARCDLPQAIRTDLGGRHEISIFTDPDEWCVHGESAPSRPRVGTSFRSCTGTVCCGRCCVSPVPTAPPPGCP